METAREKIEVRAMESGNLGAESAWLFSRNIDISAFLGSALASLLLLAVGWQLGILNEESPDWTWISAVVDELPRVL
jgi:hypothetical protein